MLQPKPLLNMSKPFTPVSILKPIAFTTTHPPQRPSLQEWLREFRCGIRYNKHASTYLDWHLVQASTPSVRLNTNPTTSAK